MTIEERDTAVAMRRAANEITKHFNEPKTIDWEQRRYEIAKDVLCAWYASGRTDGLEMDINDAVRTADELIKRLKGGEQ